MGAAIGAAVGGAIWYAIFHFMDFDIGLFAFIPAVLSGLLGRFMAKQEDSVIGVAAVVCALIAIFGTRYAIYTKDTSEVLDSIAALVPTYDERMEEARAAVAASTSDDEIRKHLQDVERKIFLKYADKDEKYEPEGISKERVESFKKYALPDHKDFIDGKPSREEYDKQTQAAKDLGQSLTRKGTLVAVFLRTGVFGIVFLFFALKSAYRIGAG